MAVRTITKITKTQWHQVANGFSAASVSKELTLDPFLNVDHFHMSQPIFSPHPHAGFSAVTLIFEDSVGSFTNRDTLSEKVEFIHPGDLHWTTAGRGLMHEEIPAKRGEDGHGLQIFANLPAKDKLTDPKADHLSAKDTPVYDKDGTRVRVLTGDAFGLSSPVKPIKPVTILDVFLSKGATFSHKTPKDDNLFILVVKGKGVFGPAENSKELSEDSAANFSNGEEFVAKNNNDEKLHFVLFHGQPIKEPVTFMGPFCGVSYEQARSFAVDYQVGKMGHLESSF